MRDYFTRNVYSSIIFIHRVRPLNEKERRGLDPSVVTFPGNGQILVCIDKMSPTTNQSVYKINDDFSVKVYLEDPAEVKSPNYLDIMWCLNQAQRKPMC